MDFDLNIFKIRHNNLPPKKGRVLVSEPFAKDSFFKRSVVLITEHNKDGTIGFILNKPINYPINEIIKDFPYIESNISIGGPVKTDSIHYVHTLGDSIPGSMKVLNNLYWGGDFEILKQKSSLGLLKGSEVKFFVGYSGWQPNQLETEISKDFWLVTELNAEDIMGDSNWVWKAALNKLDEKYKVWANFPENPNFN